jgi:hypothetical protein
MVVRYELHDADCGTLVAIHATGEPRSFFRWAAPVMTQAVRKSITADLERLRTCLEM